MVESKKLPSCNQDGRHARYTTYYCIPTYALPVTAGLPARPNGYLQRTPCLYLSACDSGVIFGIRLQAPGFHHTPDRCFRLLRPYCLRQSLSLLNTAGKDFFFLTVGPMKDKTVPLPSHTPYYIDSSLNCQGLEEEI